MSENHTHTHPHPYHHCSSSDELFEYRSVEKQRLWLAIIVTGTVMLVEVAGGILTNSLALISDAGHMFTHFFALLVSLGAILFASRPACHHRTFGFYRVEILAALLNGVFLFVVTGWILYESAQRIFHPAEVQEIQMLVVSVIGLIANLISAVLLHGANKKDLNVRSAFLHMVADTLSSVAIIVGAGVIYFTGWNIVDPILSIGIACLIFRWGWGLLKDSTHILLEGAPKGVTSDMVEKLLFDSVPEIKDISQLHMWTITSEMFYLTAHISLNGIYSMGEMIVIRTRIKDLLKDHFAIANVTIEFNGPV